MAEHRPVKIDEQVQGRTLPTDREITGRGGVAQKKVGTFPLEQRRLWIESNHEELSIVEQCRLSGVSRSGLYYRPVGESAENIALMRLLDEQYTRTPFYGIRRMTWWLETARSAGQCEAGSATAAAHGTRSDLPQTAVVDAGPGTPDLPIPVAPSGDCASRSGLGHGYQCAAAAQGEAQDEVTRV